MKRRILFIPGREADYIRNRVVIAALSSHFDVTVCTTRARTTMGRTVSSLSKFLARRPDYDLCFAGFYGQPIAIALSLLQHQPIVLDAYVSTYDTLCHDRCWFRPASAMGRAAYWLDSRGCRSADHVITDTDAHARYFADTFNVPSAKLTTVYVGTDEDLFYPRTELSAAGGSTHVFYYSGFLPLHGTEVIIKAAALLRDRPDIHFTLGGDGRRRRRLEQLIDDLDLNNVALVGWIPLERLPEYINQASICLGGHFSTVPKAGRVIPTKVFQFVAMRKPTIVGDSPAMRELFVPREHVWTVKMGSHEALAEAIRTLADDDGLRQRLAAGGYEVYQQELTTAALGDRLTLVVEEALCGSAS